MKVLVIGSNSFAGSYFCDYLISKKLKVYGISRSKQEKNYFLKYSYNKFSKNFFNFYKLDINDNLKKIIYLIKKKKIEYIINFTAQGMVAESWIKPEDWYKTNTLSNSVLISHLSKLKFIKKYLNFSTPEVYGNTDLKKKENTNFNPSTPYAISRAAQDFNLIAYYKSFGFPINITRAANIYGPHQKLYRIIPKTILCGLKKKYLPLHGSGNSMRSFIHMSDVCEALSQILFDNKNIGDTFHISTNEFIKINTLVNKIFKKIDINRPLIKITQERIGKDSNYFLNSNFLRKKYNWRDKISLSDGLDEVVEWVKFNIKNFKENEFKYIHKK